MGCKYFLNGQRVALFISNCLMFENLNNMTNSSHACGIKAPAIASYTQLYNKVY